MVSPLTVGTGVLQAGGRDAEHPVAPDQAAIVATEAPALRVTAPAGSGKTRTMVEWAVDRARRLTPGDGRAVLAVSFTNRSAADLQVRVAAALAGAGLPLDLVRVSTFHSLASHLIGEFGHHLGLPTSMRLIGDADATALVETVLSDRELDEMDAGNLPTAVSGVLRLASSLSDHHVAVSDAIAWHEARLADYEAHRGDVDGYRNKGSRDRCEVARLTTAERLDLLRVVAPFRALKRERGVLDYGDQLVLGAELAALDEVGAELRRRFPYLVVDEYQDTNVVQRELLQRLWDPDASQLVVVGDDLQAIYGFRGATLDNFTSFAEHFPGARDAHLVNVYRHGEEIVRVAGAVAEPARERETAPLGGPSSVRAVEFPDQRAEAAWIAGQVEQLTADDPRDVCVLAPQRRFLVPIVRQLEDRGIPVEAPGLRGLLDSPTFHTVHALLQIAHDPGNSIAAARLLRSPRYRLGPHDIVSFVEAASDIAWDERKDARLEWYEDAGVRLLDGLLDTSRAPSGEVRERVEAFLADVRRWVSLARTLPLAELVEQAAGELGLIDALATAPGALAIRARSELQAAIDSARDYERVDPGAGLGGYLDHLERVLAEDEDIEVSAPDPSARAVRLLTVHSAKGLQFRHVVLTGLVKGGLPNEGKGPDETAAAGRAAIPFSLRSDVPRPSPRLWDYEAIAEHGTHLRKQTDDEQRRLFYVACTRAQETLLLTRSHWVWNADFTPAKRPCASPYFDALADAGVPVERVGGSPPDESPLEPLLLFDPPEPAEPSTLELAVVGRGDINAAAQQVGADPAELDTVRELARTLQAREEALRPPAPAPPVEHTVTDLVLALRCPVAYAQRKVLGLPQPVSAAARRGSLVHQWIEERAWALQEGAGPGAVARLWRPSDPGRDGGRPEQVVVDEDEGAEAVEDDPPEPLETDADADRCADTWLQTPYATMLPAATELPVVLTIGGRYIRGTVDLVYERPDGGLEVVDIKTGPLPTDDAGWLQLDAYALAVAGDRGPDAVRVTFVSLRGSQPEVKSRAWRGPSVAEDLRTALDRIEGTYECPGCHLCR